MKIDTKKYTRCWNCSEVVERINYKTYVGVPTCVHCKASYPEKPKLEAKLTLLQDKYLKTKDKKDLDALFIDLSKLTFNIICSKLKGSAKSLDRDKIQDMVQWSLMKLYSYYKKPNWSIQGSFTGYISQVVLYPLYNNKQKKIDENEVSINTPVRKKGDREQTYLDVLSEQEVSELNSIDCFTNKIEKDNVVKECVEFFNTSLDRLYKSNKNNKGLSKVVELVSCYKHFVYKKNDRFFSELWRTCSIDLRENFDGSINILKETLSNR